MYHCELLEIAEYKALWDEAEDAVNRWHEAVGLFGVGSDEDGEAIKKVVLKQNLCKAWRDANTDFINNELTLKADKNGSSENV